MCVHCGRSYTCNNGGTGNLWKHVKKTHPIALDVPATVGALDRFFGAAEEAVIYSKEAFKEELIKWLVSEGMPFTAVESRGFRRVVRMLRSDAAVPSVWWSN